MAYLPTNVTLQEYRASLRDPPYAAMFVQAEGQKGEEYQSLAGKEVACPPQKNALARSDKGDPNTGPIYPFFCKSSHLC